MRRIQIVWPCVSVAWFGCGAGQHVAAKTDRFRDGGSRHESPGDENTSSAHRTSDVSVWKSRSVPRNSVRTEGRFAAALMTLAAGLTPEQLAAQ